MAEGSVRPWQVEPRCFGRSGTLRRGDCYLTRETLGLRYRRPTMAQRRGLAVPVEHSYPEKVHLQEHQQVRSESAPKWVSPAT
jgi:hypothetical protein